MSTGTIEVGVSHGKDPHTAVEDALDQLSEDPDLALVFFSPRHADEIEAALEQLPDECHSLGCSTAGELTPDGYTQGEVVVALVRSPYLALETHRITFESNGPKSARKAGRDFVLGAIEKLRDPGPCLDITFNAMLRSLRAGRPTRVLPYFMIELVDGLFPAIDYYVDGINEVVHRFNFLEVYGGAPEMTCGSSAPTRSRTASCARSTRRSWSSGSPHLRSAAAWTAGSTPCPRTGSPSPRPSRVSVACSSSRGEPAADYYAEVVGVSAEKLDDEVFMWNPLGWEIFGGQIIVREPARAEDDGSLRFHSRPPASGTLIRLQPTREGMAETARQVTERAMARAGISDPEEVALVLVFDCAHRDCDEQYDAIREVVGDEVPIVGFKTYGEHGQLETGPVGHFNQTIEVVVVGRELVSQ